MAHLHVLHIQPQIYTELLEGDDDHPYYIYVGATEDFSRRHTQHKQAYDAFHSTTGNDGWCTPDFTRKHHRVKRTLQLQFVEGGQACAALERDSFMQWFHLHDCDMSIVRGDDWCKADRPLQWTDKKSYRRNTFGPTLRVAYDRWVASGRAAEVDQHKDGLLGWIQANL